MNILDLDTLSKNLSEPQFEAAQFVDGPSLILAGAGSGKTRTLTYKMAHLVSHHKVSPKRIVAVTFTNKAAKEMRTRLDSLVGETFYYPWMGTFHGLCVRLLRRILPDPRPGISGVLTNRFSIFDDDDQRKLLKGIAKTELHWEGTTSEIRAAKGAISNWKNKNISPEAALSEAEFIDQKELADLYGKYQKHLEQNNALDFDDLLCHTVHVLEGDAEIRNNLSKNFDAFFVDEYQDTNPVQYKLLRLLLGENDRITVVGDDDQSIYGWRGADIEILKSFERDFSQAKIFKLEENYRSTKSIVQVAGSVIANNSRQASLEKNVFSKRDSGNLVKEYLFDDEYAEANWIAEQIGSLKPDNWANVAIFYRTNAQSRSLEAALHKERIPCHIVGGQSFYQRKEVKDIMGYLRLICNPDDGISLKRIINTPKRGIGATSLEKLDTFAREQRQSLYSALAFSPQVLSNAASKKVLAFAEQMRTWRQASKQNPLSVLLETLLKESGLVDSLLKEDDGQDRVDNLNEFLNAVVEAEEENPELTLEEFLQDLALVSEPPDASKQTGVTLMTLHAAKGLEFPRVYLTGVNEGVLPMQRHGEEDQVEEERRLFYVGCTRAEEFLYITAPRIRRVKGYNERVRLSRFLREMDQSCVEKRDLSSFDGNSQVSEKFASRSNYNDRPWQQDKPSYGNKSYAARIQAAKKVASRFADQPKGASSPKASSFKAATSSKGALAVGARVQHPKFGYGIVKSCSGTDENSRIEIDFQGVGSKKLVLKFANLSIVG